MLFSFLGFCFSWALHFLPTMSSSNVDSSSFDQIEEPPEETIPDSFICCVCLDLLYKPIVLECGHVSCFWCVHKSMDPIRESHCPICRNPYYHFPTVCEMLHFLLLKMYPLAYKRREKQILEEEKKMGIFSPELIQQEIKTVDGSNSHGANILSDTLSTASSIGEDKDSLKVEADGSYSAKENNVPAVAHDRTCKKVSSVDLLCPACQKLLFRPAVLNCGHVFCEACIKVPEDGIIICKVCEIPHPNDYPNICLELNNFLGEQFPEDYAVQKENVKQMEARFQHKNPSSCTGTKKAAKKACRDNDEGLRWWRERGSKAHYGAGCDYCGVFPIVGDRYRCEDCVEAVGFDLCEDCYNTRSKRPGRFNQQHTPEHRFKLIKPPDMARNLVLRLVGGHLVDSSGTPVPAISAIEDASDGWVAVESGTLAQSIEGNAIVLDGIHDSEMPGNAQDVSISVEVSNAPETSSNNTGQVPPQDDHSMEQQEEDSPSTS